MCGGANRVRGDVALTWNVDATGAADLLMCLFMSGCHKTHVLCRVQLLIPHAESLYYSV